MILSSPINDRYFHECFSQPIVSNPEISSCSDTNFVDVSNICLCVGSVVFAMELQLFWYATLEILFCLFRTWSFTRFTNDLDSTDNSNSVSSFPMTNCWGLTSSRELISSGRPHLSRSVSPFLTDCAVPSRRISSWPGRTFRTILQEVLSGRPDRSYVLISVFHSWEDQARSSSHFE